jgi:hypothetical protein
MIHYSLKCVAGHEFDSWFRSSAVYDEQAALGALECPICGSAKVEKAIMAPAVAKGAREKQVVAAPGPAGGAAEFEKLAAKLRAHVEANFDYVGEKFPEEARAIHYGERDERAIYGEASPDEARSLAEEGIKIAALPGAKKPRAKMN